jgi:putative transposase
VLRVLDAWSRKVVGSCIDRRRPPRWSTLRSAWPSSDGNRAMARSSTANTSQYSSWAFRRRIRGAGLAHSLGTIGVAFDNALVESFWAQMQTELLDTRRWRTRVELSSAIFDWIEAFHNRVRRHSALGMMSPVADKKINSQHANVA